MKKILKLTSGFVILYFIIFTFIVAFFIKQSPVSPQPDPTPTTLSSQAPAPIATLQRQDPFADLKNHNNQSNCWVSYQGHIYNITSYFGSHPGGDELLLKYCGKDMAAAFNSKEKSPPQTHSEAAKSMLEPYLVK